MIYADYKDKYAWFSNGDSLEYALFLTPVVALFGALFFWAASNHVIPDRCARPRWFALHSLTLLMPCSLRASRSSTAVDLRLVNDPADDSLLVH